MEKGFKSIQIYQLSLNITKTQFMLYHRWRHIDYVPNSQISDVAVSKTDYIKFRFVLFSFVWYSVILLCINRCNISVQQLLYFQYAHIVLCTYYAHFKQYCLGNRGPYKSAWFLAQFVIISAVLYFAVS